MDFFACCAKLSLLLSRFSNASGIYAISSSSSKAKLVRDHAAKQGTVDAASCIYAVMQLRI